VTTLDETPDSVGDSGSRTEQSSGRQRAESRLLDWYRRLSAWSNRVGFERKLAIGLTVAALCAVAVTYVALSEPSVLALDPRSIILLFTLDLFLMLLLVVIIARRVALLWSARRRGRAGARLHGRMVVMFGLVAVTPAVLVAIFSALFMNFSVQGWFSEQVSTAVKESLEVAEAYLQEHRRTIVADALAMARDINREGPLLINKPELFNRFVAAQADIRGLTEAIVFDSSGRVLARGGFSLVLEFDFDMDIPAAALERARNGEVLILTGESDDRVRALVRLESLIDSFLYVGRLVDLRVLQHMDRTRGAVGLYEALEKERSEVQITFAMIFAVICLLLLLAAVWVGLFFATNLTRPIGGLIEAAEKIAAGDLHARAPHESRGDELGILTRTFNRMTGQLESQQQALVDANRQIDERRRFTEAVLSGVSAGVIGLDSKARIDLPNRTAQEFLATDASALIGRRFADVAPEMAHLVDEARQNPRRIAEEQIQVSRGGRRRTLLVRVGAEVSDAGLDGFVVTFDDITVLMSAQRKAAWAGVARRIAHEIKNPLTPIQLSAERLKRRYGHLAGSDADIFDVCIDTIVRQVGLIGRMVDEFSNFARMPAPSIRPEDIGELCRQALFLQSTAHPQIKFDSDLPGRPAMVDCDARQISQALTNILQNGVEAIEARHTREPAEAPPGRIALHMEQDADTLAIVVVDNGCGIPEDLRHRLTEPYVTTREKGTGLGLAIVRKIMEDHGGELVLDDARGGGAIVKLVFKRPADGTA
jgi:two-component system nitrogen regulation sensor histidine kinase NtrY